MKLSSVLLAGAILACGLANPAAAGRLDAITTTPIRASGAGAPPPMSLQSVAGDVAVNGAAWLQAQQAAGGDFPWTAGEAATYGNTQGATALGLVRAYERTGLDAQLAAAQSAGNCILANCTGGMHYADGDHRFATHDPLFLEALTLASGNAAYAGLVQSDFWDKLAAGEYGATDDMSAAEFGAYVVSARGGISELAAWDLSKLAIAAHLAGEISARDGFLAGILASLESTTGTTRTTYDVIGLAGAVWAAAVTGQELDPAAGRWLAAGSTADLASALSGFQTPGGGFVTGSAEALLDANAGAQSTAFAVLALHAADPVAHAGAVNNGIAFLAGLQAGDGQFLSYLGAAPTATGGVESHGESLEAYSVVRLGTDRYVDPSGTDTGDCSQPALACRTIQYAVDQANEGNTIHIATGTYVDPVTVVTAGLRLVGEGDARLDRLAGPTNQSLVRISAPSVIVQGLAFDVDRTFAGEGILCVGACTALTVLDSVFEQRVSNPGVLSSYGRTNAISAGVQVSGLPGATGPVQLTVQGVVVRNAAAQPQALFRAGVALDNGFGLIGGLEPGQANDIVSRNHDVIVRNGRGGAAEIVGNLLRGFGVQVTTPQPDAGAASIAANQFLTPPMPYMAGDFSALRLISNPHGIPVSVSGNSFDGHERGILVENFPAVTLQGNSFTPRAGTAAFQHVVVSNKELFSNATPPAPLPEALALQAHGNIFHAGTEPGGTAVLLLNDNAQGVPGFDYYGALVFGEAGNPNAFDGPFGRIFELGNFDCTSSNDPPCPLDALYSAVSASMPGTPVVRFAGDVSALHNTFDGVAPAAMDAAQRNLLLARTQDAASDPALGAVDYGFTAVQPLVFVDDDFSSAAYGQAFSFAHPDPAANGRTVYVGVDAFASIGAALAAVADGGTAYIADGTYAENVTLTKQVNLVGSGSTATTALQGALGIAVSGTETVPLAIAGLVVSNPAGAGLTLSGTVSHLHFSGVAFQGNAGSGVVFAGTGTAGIVFEGTDADDCRFQDNAEFGVRATTMAVASGVRFDNCLFQDNQAGIVLFGGSSSGTGQISDWSVLDSRFLSNDAADATPWGGGIWVKTGGPGSVIDGFEVRGSVFEDNGSGGLYPGSVPAEDRRHLNRVGITVRARAGTVLRDVVLCDNRYAETAARPGTQEVGVAVFDQASGTPGGDYQPVEVCGINAADALLGLSGYEQFITGDGEPRLALTGSVALANGGAGWQHVDLGLRDPVYVDDDFAGLPNGTPVNADHPAAPPATAIVGLDAFATIADGLAHAASNGFVYVEAGEYVESAGPGQVLAISRPVNLVGAQAGLDARGRSDAGASVVRPGVGIPLSATSIGQLALVDIASDDVLVEGFVLDGDNAAIATGFAMGGADPDVDSGIFATGSRITLARNVLRNFVGTGVFGWSDASGDTGNAVIQSRFENMVAPSRWGIAVIAADNWYVAITDNAMDGVRIGVQTNNFHAPDAMGFGGLIAGNDMEVTRNGVFHNLFYSGATPWTIADNVVTGLDDALEPARFSGIWIESMQGNLTATISGNVIDGGAVTGRLAYGYELNNWTSTESASTTISGGSVTGTDVGVLATDGTHYTGLVLDARVQDVAFAGIGIASVMVEDTVEIAGGARITLATGNGFDPARPALALAGPGATVGFDGIAGVDHVLVRSAGDFLYGLSGASGVLSRAPGLVASGMAAVVDGGMVELEQGAFQQNVVISRPLTLRGPGHATPGPMRDGSAEAELSATTGQVIRVNAHGVVVEGLTVTGLSGASDAVGLASGGNFGGTAHGVTVRNNRFVNLQGTAIYTNTDTSAGPLLGGWQVSGNLVQGIAGAGFSGINLWKVADARIEGNVVRDVGFGGIQLVEGSNVQVLGNHVSDTGNNGINIGPDLAGVQVAGNVVTGANNDGSDADEAGLTLFGGSSDIQVYCNLFDATGGVNAISTKDEGVFLPAELPLGSGIAIFHNSVLGSASISHSNSLSPLVVGSNWYGGAGPVLGGDNQAALAMAGELAAAPVAPDGSPVAGCGDNAPAAVQIVSGSPQNTVIGTSFALPLRARLVDALGGAVPGMPLVFEPPSSGASALLGAQVGTTDHDGMRQSSALANGLAGSYLLPVVHEVEGGPLDGTHLSASFDLRNDKGTGTVAWGDLQLVYNGAPQAPSAGIVEDPTASCMVTPTAGADVGSYGVTATCSGDNYVASGSETATIVAKPVTIVFDGLGSFVYDGNPHPVSASVAGIEPGDSLPLLVTYSGSDSAPTDAGAYIVTGVFDDAAGDAANYVALPGVGSLVITKAQATVSIDSDDLEQQFGETRPVDATATPLSPAPATGTVLVTYDGSTTPPTAVGAYAVLAEVQDPNHEGVASATLFIRDAADISLSLLPTDPMALVEAATAPYTDFVDYGGTIANAGGVTAQPVHYRIRVARVDDGNALDGEPVAIALEDVKACVYDPSGWAAQAGDHDGCEQDFEWLFKEAGALNGRPAVSFRYPNLPENDLALGNTGGAVVLPPATLRFRPGEYRVQVDVVGSSDGMVYASATTNTTTVPNVAIGYNGGTSGPAEQLLLSTATLANSGGRVDVPVRVRVTLSDATATPEAPVLLAPGDAELFYQLGDAYQPLPWAAQAAADGGLVTWYGPASGFPLEDGHNDTDPGAGLFHRTGAYRLRYEVVDAATGTQLFASSEAGLTIAANAVAFTLSDLQQVYDGTPRAVSVAPSDVPHTVLYEALAGASCPLAPVGGSTSPPTDAGTWCVYVSADGNYSGSASGQLLVAKAEAEVSIDGAVAGVVSRAYDGTAQVVTASTPALLSGSVVVSYDGSLAPPVAAGSYSLLARIEDPNHHGAASGLLIVSADGGATIVLDDDDGTPDGEIMRGYDGDPQPVTATVVPAIGYTVSYAGSGATVYPSTSEPPSAAGTYAVIATTTDPNYAPVSASGLLRIEPAAVAISITGLDHVYDGTGKAAVVSTDPPVAFSVSYAGAASLPVDAGSYAVQVQVTDPDYSGSATAELVIAQAPVTLSFGNLAHTYDGSARHASVTTVPGGVAVALAYLDGSDPVVAPLDAGSYTVVASLADSNFVVEGSDSATLVIAKAVAQVSLSDLTQVYDGLGKAATAATTPAGLEVELSYDGGAALPVAVGTHAVHAVVVNDNYRGEASATLTIVAAAVAGFSADGPTSFSGTAGALLPGALPTVRVVDTSGNGVPGMGVRFVAASGAIPGFADGQLVLTGADGRASVAGWLLPAAAGNSSMSAEIPGLSGLPAQAFSASGAEVADLAVLKTSLQDVVKHGDIVDYTIVVTNGGPSDAGVVEIMDLLPASLDLGSAAWSCTAAAGASCNGVDGGSGDALVDATLPVGGSIQIVLSAAVAEEAPLAPFANTASALLQSGVDPVPGNDTSTSTVGVVAGGDVPAIFSDGFEGDDAAGAQRDAD